MPQTAEQQKTDRIVNRRLAGSDPPVGARFKIKIDVESARQASVTHKVTVRFSPATAALYRACARDNCCSCHKFCFSSLFPDIPYVFVLFRMELNLAE
jgi:hypothetical protein